ncbi:MAG: hypothetical protein WCT40_04530 [Candidatus Magasanikbacteria bacterium]|jgi:hypothetical protein
MFRSGRRSWPFEVKVALLCGAIGIIAMVALSPVVHYFIPK